MIQPYTIKKRRILGKESYMSNIAEIEVVFSKWTKRNHLPSLFSVKCVNIFCNKLYKLSPGHPGYHLFDDTTQNIFLLLYVEVLSWNFATLGKPMWCIRTQILKMMMKFWFILICRVFYYYFIVNPFKIIIMVNNCYLISLISCFKLTKKFLYLGNKS